MRIRRRDLIAGVLSTVLLHRHATAAGSQRKYDAIVGEDGHASISEALAGAPAAGVRPYRILLRAGLWREKLTIDKPFIHLIGEHRQRSIIDYDAWSGQRSPQGEPWGTRRSATLSIAAPDCALRNLTVSNSFDYDRAATEPPPNASFGPQAVALALIAGADRTTLEQVSVEGHQDTLLSDAGRASFQRCLIRGHVDFVFGAGTAWFDRCAIQARPRATDFERMGYLSAPSTLRTTQYGLIFQRCRLTKEPGVPARSFALGRPWRPTASFADGRYGNPEAVGQAVFLHCWMDDHITAPGWDRMSYGTREGERAYLEPAEARFAEYHSRGPGAVASVSRPVLSPSQARAFNRDAVLGGWRAARV